MVGEERRQEERAVVTGKSRCAPQIARGLRRALHAEAKGDAARGGRVSGGAVRSERAGGDVRSPDERGRTAPHPLGQ